MKIGIVSYHIHQGGGDIGIGNDNATMAKEKGTHENGYVHLNDVTDLKRTTRVGNVDKAYFFFHEIHSFCYISSLYLFKRLIDESFWSSFERV